MYLIQCLVVILAEFRRFFKVVDSDFSVLMHVVLQLDHVFRDIYRWRRRRVTFFRLDQRG